MIYWTAISSIVVLVHVLEVELQLFALLLDEVPRLFRHCSFILIVTFFMEDWFCWFRQYFNLFFRYINLCLVPQSNMAKRWLNGVNWNTIVHHTWIRCGLAQLWKIALELDLVTKVSVIWDMFIEVRCFVYLDVRIVDWWLRLLPIILQVVCIIQHFILKLEEARFVLLSIVEVFLLCI